MIVLQLRKLGAVSHEAHTVASMGKPLAACLSCGSVIAHT